MSLNYNNVAIILAKIRIEFKFKDELARNQDEFNFLNL